MLILKVSSRFGGHRAKLNMYVVRLKMLERVNSLWA